MTESNFEATVADVKNGKTKLVIKFDAEEIEREQLANLNSLVNRKVEVIVKPLPVIVKDEDYEGQEYEVNGRGEVDVQGQTNIDEFIAGSDEAEPEEKEDSLPFEPSLDEQNLYDLDL
jgi:hypothetical protein